MLRKRFSLNLNTDAAIVLSNLRNACNAAGFSSQQTEDLVAQVSGPLESMIQNGHAVASASGQFRATREIKTDIAAITLDARFGIPEGFFNRLWKAFTWGNS